MGLKIHEQPPYLPDLAPSDYQLFSQLEKSLKDLKCLPTKKL